MPHKHPNDLRANRRRYYREHEETIKEQAAQWYTDNKGAEEYKLRKSRYMVIWRRRKKNGE